jgi:hypothetical protein
VPEVLLVDAGAIAFGVWQWLDFRRGRVWFGNQWVYRDQSPIGFWTGHLFFWFLIGFVLLFPWIKEIGQ